MRFADARHAAKLGEGAAAGLVRRHAGADVVVDVEIEMALQLVGELALTASGRDEAE